MALAEQAELVAKFSLKDNVSGPGMKIKGVLGGLSSQTAKLHAAFGKIGAGLRTGFTRSMILGAGAVGLLVLNVKHGIASLAELERIEKQTDVVLKNRGKTTLLTAQAVRDLAQSEEDLTTIDDKAVQAAENLILPYKHISDTIFPQTVRAAEDLSTALGTDLNSAARTVGKALEDPSKGLTRLTRLGVIFTQQEQDKIKALQKDGDLLGAQQLILAKLNQMYGGSATAAANTYDGAMRRLHDGVEEVQKALAMALLPALTKIANKMGTFLKDPKVIEKISQLGETIAGLFSDSNIEAGGKALQQTFGTLASLPWDQIKNGLQVSAAAAGKAVDIFKSLPPEVQGGLITLLAANKLTGGLVASGLKDLVGLALGSLKTITAANVTVIGSNVTGGVGGGVGGGGTGVVGGVIKVAGTVAIVGATADAIVTGVAGVSDQLNRNNGKTEDQIRIMGEIATLEQTLSHVTIPAQGDLLRARIAELQAQLLVPLGNISVTTGRYGAIVADNTKPIVPGLDSLRTAAMQQAHNSNQTTNAVDHLTGIEKNRRTRIIVNVNNRNTFSVSGSAIAYELNRINRNGGMVPI